MFEALLHGKLSKKQESMEDLLTSMVFGTLQCSSPHLLGSILRSASTSDGTRPFARLPPIARATYRFWPAMLEEGCRFCEPDVLIDIEEGRLLPLVEAKFRSGKSSVAREAPNEALALAASLGLLGPLRCHRAPFRMEHHRF